MNIFIQGSNISNNYHNVCAEQITKLAYELSIEEHRDFINMLDACAFE